jgi:glycosyltransferase involved in cell wall biosynthesis
MNPKISIITAVFNREATIAAAIESLQSQVYKNIEHIIIDGSSTDGSLEKIRALADEKTKLISEPDGGIYDAMNKGIQMATGNVIGFLHSDDIFADEDVLMDVICSFAEKNVDGVYGDLNYVSPTKPIQIIRYWRAGQYSIKKLHYGWMPPHPALFLKKGFIDKWGGFRDQFQISADYDAMLRYLCLGNAKLIYLPKVLVNMNTGGESNKSVERIWRKSREDLKIIRTYKLGYFFGLDTLFFKNIIKILQFFNRKSNK